MEDPERIAREQIECDIANNNTEPPSGLYCRGTYDTWLCWPHTPANGTAFAHCPEFVPGFSPELWAHKECTSDGTWWEHPDSGKPWSNYTTCVKAEEDVSEVIILFQTGYSISLIALLISLAILLYFKSLRCARITVHINLFASFALNNALWLAWYGLVVNDADTPKENPPWCQLLNAVLQYALLTNYTWMLCEGLYLHTVLVSAFVSERRLVRVLLATGWLLPIPSAIIHAARRGAANDPFCWADEGAPRPELAVLVLVTVILNLAFLCNIVRVLCTKLRAGGGAGVARPSATALHALRATCLLAPLLGVQYLLTPFRPSREASWWRAYEYVAAIITSLQGLCVAVLYCFCNGEVLAQLRRRWRILTFRPRANSTTNTTVSFVRSGGAGGGDDRV
ncbi:calcitonin gene-related peptide type 1 receptor [Pieris rapae]|uniref:calcitonin gene-related peptide type 1 receptor n=1 Tax=Pieris rapae TaxID=64459 RepID=UPI001E27F620|nr:calcitonin gene-related peptide type 1 receptor [Pieris rapae]